jgi:Protein of unknown function (DUF3631)
VLNEDAESGWRNFGRGSGLDPSTLAELLRPYGVRPKVRRIADKTMRGYLRVDFEAVWKRYLAAEDSGEVTSDPP